MALPSNNKVIGDLGHTADHNAIVDEITYVKQNYYSASSIGVNLPDYLRRDTASSTYATIFSPELTGLPTAPTAASATNTTQIATTAFVRSAVSNLVGSAPTTLDTLNELATALGNDANFATSTASAIGQRLLASTASTLYLGINNTANHARTASSVNGLAVTGPVASANFTLFANTASSIAGVLVTGIVNNANHSSTASSINASLLTGTTLPTTIVSSSLTSVGTLSNLSVTNVINGRTASSNFAVHSNTASSISGALVSGTVANAAHANTASSMNWVGVTGRPTTLSGYGITDAAPLNSPNFSGTPTVPTASAGNSSNQIASTEWVNSAILSINSGSFVDLSAYLRKDSASVTSINHANSASSINWALVTNRPSASPNLNPQIGINLVGDITGAASVTLTSLTNGQISINTTVAANSVALGTDTTGNYVAGATAGDGITISGTAGEGWLPTISVNTAASVSWNNVSNKPTTFSGYGLTDDTIDCGGP